MGQYSVSVKEREIVTCFLVLQELGKQPRNTNQPDRDCRSSYWTTSLDWFTTTRQKLSYYVQSNLFLITSRCIRKFEMWYHVEVQTKSEIVYAQSRPNQALVWLQKLHTELCFSQSSILYTLRRIFYYQCRNLITVHFIPQRRSDTFFLK